MHAVTDLWREQVTETSGGHIAWAASWLVPPGAAGHDEAARQVSGYARAVLDAVGVITGPACTEIMLTNRGAAADRDRGRLAGCYPPN